VTSADRRPPNLGDRLRPHTKPSLFLGYPAVTESSVILYLSKFGVNIAETPTGLVTATIDELRRARANQVSCCCDGILPLRRRFGSEGPQRGPGDEVALKIERVVDGGMDTEEALRGSS
jgi:hypothetical protein